MEIKFRAWDRRKDKMIYEPLLKILSIYPQKDIMQYTGLKEKHGKEIYEGDIIRMNAEGSYRGTYHGDPMKEFDIDYTGEVVSIPSKGVCLKNPLWVDGIDGNKGKINGYKEVRSYRSEIIGNVYENHELLEP